MFEPDDYKMMQFILTSNCNSCFNKYNNCPVGIECPVLDLLSKLNTMTEADLKLKCTESFKGSNNET